MKILKEESSNVRLDFKKAGFRRDPQHDFTDDGARFLAYIHKSGMPMTYTSYQGDAYISLRLADLGELNYKEFSKLPSYKYADMYNGVPKSSVDMAKLDQVATQLMDEYNTAVEELGTVSDDALEEIILQARKIATEKYNRMVNLVKNNFDTYLELDTYKSGRITEYLKELKQKAIRLTIDNYSRLSNSSKRGIISNGVYEIIRPEDDDFYCKEIKNLLGL